MSFITIPNSLDAYLNPLLPDYSIIEYFEKKYYQGHLTEIEKNNMCEVITDVKNKTIYSCNRLLIITEATVNTVNTDELLIYKLSNYCERNAYVIISNNPFKLDSVINNENNSYTVMRF